MTSKDPSMLYVAHEFLDSEDHLVGVYNDFDLMVNACMAKAMWYQRKFHDCSFHVTVCYINQNNRDSEEFQLARGKVPEAHLTGSEFYEELRDTSGFIEAW